MTKKTPHSKPSFANKKEDQTARQERRYSGGRLVGALISDVTRPAFKKKSPLLVRLVMDWEILMGRKLATQSEPRSLRPGVLTIGCAGPAAMELRYASPQILERLNNACGLYGTSRLHTLKIKQDMIIKASPPSRKRPTPLPVTLTEFGSDAPQEAKKGEDNPLRAVLERLGGHIAAREALRKSSRK